MALKEPLGRGLGALIPAGVSDNKNQLLMCGVEELSPGHYQSRKEFAPDELQELAISIKQSGVIQPILVRRRPDKNGYEIIAGERRWRAAQKAGLKEVPVIIKKASDAEVAEMSLVENLQRENLNAMEEAEAYQKFVAEFGNTHEEIAKKIGKDRSTISNALRLLKLPVFAKASLISGKISTGHARCLLTLGSTDTMKSIHDAIVSKGLSVRATEVLVQKQKPVAATKIPTVKPRTLTDVGKSLSSALKTKVSVSYGTSGGKVSIIFSSNDDLDRIINVIRRGSMVK